MNWSTCVPNGFPIPQADGSCRRYRCPDGLYCPTIKGQEGKEKCEVIPYSSECCGKKGKRCKFCSEEYKMYKKIVREEKKKPERPEKPGEEVLPGK